MADFSISGWVDEPMKADWRISIKDYRKKNPGIKPAFHEPFYPHHGSQPFGVAEDFVNLVGDGLHLRLRGRIAHRQVQQIHRQQ